MLKYGVLCWNTELFVKIWTCKHISLSKYTSQYFKYTSQYFKHTTPYFRLFITWCYFGTTVKESCWCTLLISILVTWALTTSEWWLGPKMTAMVHMLIFAQTQYMRSDFLSDSGHEVRFFSDSVHDDRYQSSLKATGWQIST